MTGKKHQVQWSSRVACETIVFCEKRTISHGNSVRVSLHYTFTVR